MIAKVQNIIDNPYTELTDYFDSNGFTTLGDFYDKFTDGDVRKGSYIEEMSPATGILAGFLIGQQYDGFDGPESPGNPLTDRGGNPLVFTRDVDLSYSNERPGRILASIISDPRGRSPRCAP